MPPSLKSWILSIWLLLNLLQHYFFVITANAMRCHVPIVQFHFTYEGLPPFLFTPRTNHFHDVSWSSMVNVEYRTTNNRQR